MFTTVWLCCGKRAGQGSQGLGTGIAEHSKMPGPVPSPVIGLIPPGPGHFLRSTLANPSPASEPLTWRDNSILCTQRLHLYFFFFFFFGLFFIKLWPPLHTQACSWDTTEALRGWHMLGDRQAGNHLGHALRLHHWLNRSRCLWTGRPGRSRAAGSELPWCPGACWRGQGP